jgi:hypothetical protein
MPTKASWHDDQTNVRAATLRHEVVKLITHDVMTADRAKQYDFVNDRNEIRRTSSRYPVLYDALPLAAKLNPGHHVGIVRMFVQDRRGRSLRILLGLQQSRHDQRLIDGDPRGLSLRDEKLPVLVTKAMTRPPAPGSRNLGEQG